MSVLKSLMSLVLMCMTAALSAQPFADSLRTQKPNNEKDFTFGIRGKIAGMVIIEDQFVSAINLGAELWFRQRHAIGFDAGKMNLRSETDDDDDLQMYQQFKRRKYIYADYRYVFSHRKLTWWYINAYHRSGKYDMFYKKADYDFGTKDMSFLESNTNGVYHEEGLGIGGKFFFESAKDRFCMDITMNCASRRNKNVVYEVIDTQHTSANLIQKSNDILFVMRWNLCYLFR